MNGLLESVAIICIALITVRLFENFLPTSCTASQYKIVVGVVLFGVMLSALSGVKTDFKDISTEYDDYDYFEQTAGSYARIVSVILEDNGIENAKISVDTSINEQNGIQLNEIEVLAKDIGDRAKIENEINALFNVPVRITNEE